MIKKRLTINERRRRRIIMGAVNTFVALYMIGVMVVLLILSILAYKKRVERGEIDD